MLLFASSCINLTPQSPCPLGGFPRPGNYERVHDPIEARLFLFNVGGKKTVFVGTDLGGMAEVYSLTLEKIAALRPDIQPSDLVLGHSTNHSGPALQVDYLEFCTYLLAEAVVWLWDQPGEPVTVKRATVSIDGLYSVATDKNLMCDKDVELLGFFSGEKLRGLFLNMSVLCTEIRVTNELTGDLFGAIRAQLEEAYGVPVLMSNGCSGRVSTRQYREPDRKEFDAVAYFARELCAQIRSRLEWKPVSMDSFVYGETVYWEQYVPERQRYEEQLQGLKAAMPHMNDLRELDAAWQEVKEVYDVWRFNEAKEANFEIRFYRFGEILIITVPVKLGPEFGLKIKAACKDTCIIWGSTNSADEFHLTDTEIRAKGSPEEKHYYPKGTARKFSNHIIKKMRDLEHLSEKEKL